jgi:signal transduction histidine kinase
MTAPDPQHDPTARANHPGTVPTLFPERVPASSEAIEPLLEPYLRHAAHELRNAFGAVLGWASVLRRSRDASPLLVQGMEAIDRNVRLQTDLLEDLLDGARLVRGPLPLEIARLRLAAVLTQTLEELAPQAARAEVRLRPGFVEDDLGVRADEPRLRRMLAALLRTALASTARGGAVAIGAHPAASEVEIRIVDAGLDAGGRSETRLASGLAPQVVPLPLLLVARLAELQGGRLDVYGGGGESRSDLRLRLPRF